ncbi:SMI1/KNR4 family protein [Paenibacillus bovis]|uniref:Knr4/Smi1-like domain-containing protein n=1 Tax=Paenibacillus bovis TaxID=1616788 RepID=A0A172ZFS9_9BACL|nr:SMI1/KNR4 family protein [Paenibacillus bovis]ANF96468.1 hypothetical protein AR543_10950 [Paenibacillus bovis]
MLTLSEIKQKLDDKFIPLQDIVNGLRLMERKQNVTAQVRQLEQQLGMSLPADFADFVHAYDLDNFGLCNVTFGTENDYVKWVLDINTTSGFDRWWSGSERPAALICIALSDPYTLLLNLQTNEVYAMTSETQDGEWQRVASHFSLFIRGLGTAYLESVSPKQLAQETEAETLNFWQWAVNQGTPA